ncbi:hypothetical protein C5E46_00060 [Nocardia nova]|nr:hypothetical protein C5E46_00060 [Nocardia nova]
MSYSNGPIEGVDTKTKLIKRQMYGRASFELLRQPDPARIDGPPPEGSRAVIRQSQSRSLSGDAVAACSARVAHGTAVQPNDRREAVSMCVCGCCADLLSASMGWSRL